MKPVVLVTAIGTVTATAIVRMLKKQNEFHIIGADINQREDIATSLDVDEFFSFPMAADESYIDFAVEFCKTHNVDYYYAVIDKEVTSLSNNREKFDEIGTKLCVVNSEFANICHYKDKFGEWIAKNLPEISIRSFGVNDIDSTCFPVFIKPVEGVASSGCRKIESPEEFKTVISSDDPIKNYVIQEYVTGQNITVDCIRNKKSGQMMQIQRRELLRNSNGCGIAVEIFHDEKLEKICCELMQKLDLNGVANIEFFDTPNGYRIIEINPRFSAGTLYSCMAGVNTVMNAMCISDGRDCEFGPVEIGARFAERYEAYKMN